MCQFQPSILNEIGRSIRWALGIAFLISVGDEHRVTTAASSYGKWNKMKFSVRKVPEGFRCWRVEYGVKNELIRT
jgi:hypothetical protein